MTKETPYMKTPTHEQRTAPEEPHWKGQCINYLGLKSDLLARNLALSSGKLHHENSPK